MYEFVHLEKLVPFGSYIRLQELFITRTDEFNKCSKITYLDTYLTQVYDLGTETRVKLRNRCDKYRVFSKKTELQRRIRRLTIELCRF